MKAATKPRSEVSDFFDKTVEHLDPGRLFPALSIGKYRLNFRIKGKSRLKGHSGSPWRGVLGHTLQKKFCPWTSGRNCASCNVSDDCIYDFLFGRTGSMKLFQTPPRPYMIRQTGKTPYKYQVELTVTGLSDDKILRVLSAFQDVGNIGWNKNSTRVRLSSIDQLVPGGKWRRVLSQNNISRFNRTSWLLKDYLDEHSYHSPPWSVKIVTSLRLKQDGRTLNNIPWDWVFERFARRLSLLENPAYDREPEPLPWEDLKTFFCNFGTSIGVNYWHDQHRFSSPQGRVIPAGGLRGVCLVTPPEETEKLWARWWHAASLLHLGNKTTIGNGCIEFNQNRQEEAYAATAANNR